MFILRSIRGENKGQYYAGIDGPFIVLWESDSSSAEKVSGQDAAGVVMAMIDRLDIVVPEKTPSTTDCEVEEFVEWLAGGMFQNPCDGLKELIRRVIRNSPSDPIYDQLYLDGCHDGYMSVFEWLSRSLVANVDPVKK